MRVSPTVRWFLIAIASLVAFMAAINIAFRLLDPSASQNTTLWGKFNAAVHRPNGPVDGAFVLNGLRADASPAEVERWAGNWDGGILKGGVAVNRNPDGSPSVIARGIYLEGGESDGAAKGQRIMENLLLKCDKKGRPLTVSIRFMLKDGGPPLVREVDVASGRITESSGGLRNLRVEEPR